MSLAVMGEPIMLGAAQGTPSPPRGIGLKVGNANPDMPSGPETPQVGSIGGGGGSNCAWALVATMWPDGPLAFNGRWSWDAKFLAASEAEERAERARNLDV